MFGNRELSTSTNHKNSLNQPEDESWKEAMEYLGSVREAQYHTQIVLMMYEDRHLPEGDPNRFRVSINFSPGTAACQRKVNERLNAMSGM